MTASVRHLAVVRDVATTATRDELDAAGNVVRAMVQNIAMTRYSGRMTERPVPGFEFPPTDVDPLAGLRAARFVRASAAHAVREYIAAARADGLSWREIGRACGNQGRTAPPR